MFRKNPIPWYDAPAACIAGGILVVLFCIFGVIGIRVAAALGSGCIWMPALLTALSGGVLVSLYVRNVRRKHRR